MRIILNHFTQSLTWRHSKPITLSPSPFPAIRTIYAFYLNTFILQIKHWRPPEVKRLAKGYTASVRQSFMDKPSILTHVQRPINTNRLSLVYLSQFLMLSKQKTDLIFFLSKTLLNDTEILL